jgi:hypothetical protein
VIIPALAARFKDKGKFGLGLKGRDASNFSEVQEVKMARNLRELSLEMA